MKHWPIILLCTAILPGCVTVNGGGRPMGSIVGQNEMPEPGQWCRATYPRQRSGLSRSQSQVAGRVEAIDEDGIHLTQVEARMMSGAVGGLNRLPYISRFYKNTGVGRGESSVVKPDELASLEILSEAEVRQMQPNSVAEQLAKAMPGPQRIARR